MTFYVMHDRKVYWETDNIEYAVSLAKDADGRFPQSFIIFEAVATVEKKTELKMLKEAPTVIEPVVSNLWYPSVGWVENTTGEAPFFNDEFFTIEILFRIERVTELYQKHLYNSNQMNEEIFDLLHNGDDYFIVATKLNRK